MAKTSKIAKAPKSFKSYALNKCLIGYGVVNGIINAAIFAGINAGAPDAMFGMHDIVHDLAFTGLVDQLESHLDAVRVGLVEDELSIALEGVIRVQRAGIGGIGDLLDTDDDVHGGESVRRSRAPQIDADRGLGSVSCRPRPAPSRRERQPVLTALD